MSKCHFKADEVYKLTSEIPRGKVSTYGAIAIALNVPRSSRAVGRILRANPTPIIVPCHRVVKSDGEVGGYGGKKGMPKKICLLESEGVRVKDGRIQDFHQVLYTSFSRTRNL